MKRFLAMISDIKNAMRVLEIMDECGCDIEKVTRDGLDEYDYWKIVPKWYVSGKDAKDLQKICLHKQHYCKRSKLWKKSFLILEKDIDIYMSIASSIEDSYKS